MKIDLSDAAKIGLAEACSVGNVNGVMAVQLSQPDCDWDACYLRRVLRPGSSVFVGYLCYPKSK